MDNKNTDNNINNDTKSKELENELKNLDEENKNNYVDEIENNYENKENDTLLEKGYLEMLVEQNDRVVYYEVENIYKDENKKEYKNRYDMRKDPPILVIKDNLGSEVEFILTANLNRELIASLKEVDRAYLGFSGPVDIDAPDKWSEKIVYYIKKNPIKFIIPIVILIVSLLISIL